MSNDPLIPHKPKVLLVTGGAGFIGSNFIHYWLKRYPQDRIVNLDALTYAGNLANLKEIQSNPHYTFIHGDIRDTELVDEVMNGIDLLVHFAAETHVDRSITDPDTFLSTNVMGTHNLLRSALKHQIQRFHHVSTDEVFGSLPLNSQRQFDETSPYKPRSPYSASKAASDHLVRAYGETYGLNYSISNCSNNYGPYHFPEKLFPLVITNLIEGKKIPIYGDGLNVRDWLFVTDHARAIERIILTPNLKRQTYLIGGLTKDISNLQVVKTIARLMGQDDSMIEFVDDRPGHDRRYSVDWSMIKRELGWQPSVSLEDGLQQTIDWYIKHPQWWQPLKEKEENYFNHQYKNNF